jgi:hypothetical protein
MQSMETIVLKVFNGTKISKTTKKQNLTNTTDVIWMNMVQKCWKTLSKLRNKGLKQKIDNTFKYLY